MTLLHDNFEALETKSELIRNMGHPIRLSIIEILSKAKQLNVTEIYTQLQIEQAVASHHLRIMKKSGILQSVKDGKHILYSLRHPYIKTIFKLIVEI